MAFGASNKQAIWKSLRLCTSSCQTLVNQPRHHQFFTCSRSLADGKLSNQLKRPKVNLQYFVSAFKSVDKRITSVADMQNLKRTDYRKISDPTFVSLVKSWELEQNTLKKKLIGYDTEPWAKAINGDKQKGIEGLRYIGGVDVSFSKSDLHKACAAYIILSYPDMNLVYKELKVFELTIPYICGFLAFREITPYKELIRRQLREHPQFGPDVVFVDGNGILHDKGFGMACHLGVLLDIPCIGVAKNLMMLSDINKGEELKQQLKNLETKGDTLPLIGASGTVHGVALKSTDAAKAIYVSLGHKISLDTAVKVVQSCCSKYRIPEPTRLADHLSREYLRINFPETVPDRSQRRKAQLNDILTGYTLKRLKSATRTFVNKCLGILLSKHYQHTKKRLKVREENDKT